jgi:invasion protein IalB
MKQPRSLGIKLIGTVMVALFGIGSLAAPAQAQLATGKNLSPFDLPPLPQKEIKKKKFGNWTQQCDVRPGVKEQKCALTQSVIGTREERQHRILTITVGYFGTEKKLGMILQVPLALGVFLPAGLKLNVPDTETSPIAVQFCVPQGCRATTTLSQDLVSAMKTTDKGSLEVQTISKRAIRIPISFKGFTAALKSLAKS